MMGKKKTTKKIVQLPPVAQQLQNNGEVGNQMALSGVNRKLAAMDRAVYYTSLGMCWTEVRDRISKEFGYTEGSSYVDQLVTEARRKVTDIQEQYVKGVATRNVARIEMIIQDALKNGNQNLALKAMDLLNKTTNTYSNKIEIKNDDNKSFEIKIDNKE